MDNRLFQALLTMKVSPVYNLLMSWVSLSLLLACTLRALKLSVISKEGLLRVSKTAPFRCLVNNNDKNKSDCCAMQRMFVAKMLAN